eukprot:14220312-Alexandrium_andersonii.AAC.1
MCIRDSPLARALADHGELHAQSRNQRTLVCEVGATGPLLGGHLVDDPLERATCPSTRASGRARPAAQPT